jgi:hypothetical protein
MREGGSHVRAAVGDRDDDARVTPARAVRSRSDETQGDGARSGHEIRSDEAMSSGDGRGREPTAVTVTATASRTGVSDAHAPPAVVGAGFSRLRWVGGSRRRLRQGWLVWSRQ